MLSEVPTDFKFSTCMYMGTASMLTNIALSLANTQSFTYTVNQISGSTASSTSAVKSFLSKTSELPETSLELQIENKHFSSVCFYRK